MREKVENQKEYRCGGNGVLVSAVWGEVLKENWRDVGRRGKQKWATCGGFSFLRTLGGGMAGSHGGGYIHWTSKGKGRNPGPL